MHSSKKVVVNYIWVRGFKTSYSFVSMVRNMWFFFSNLSHNGLITTLVFLPGSFIQRS